MLPEALSVLLFFLVLPIAVLTAVGGAAITFGPDSRRDEPGGILGPWR